MIQQLHDARRETDALFDIVRPEALYDRPIPERHRVVFYIGHLEAFDWNLLSGRLGLAAFDPALDRLFAFGIDPIDGGLPQDLPEDWPSLDRVFEYRDRVRAALDDANPMRADCQLLHVAVEHRLMHAETLTYMLHQLPHERKISRRVPVVTGPRVDCSGSVTVSAGPVTLGLARDGGAFGWDNEFDAHTVHVPAFVIDRCKVTNAQFDAFIAAGGYDDPALWTDDDWRWRTDAGVTAPVFWVRRNGAWLYRTMFEEIPLPPDWPVYVSHAEASAYCRWAGRRLPTEAEWQRAAEGVRCGDARRALAWDPHPVTDGGCGASRFGVEGMFGNGWEWTSTLFAPFEGFQPFPFYAGYSADFFDGKHYVLKGGSVRTAACMLRPSFRNWFQPHYRYVYATFRCVNGRTMHGDSDSYVG
jgi:gamma-glutamyl hercynylcysteine S-oxide synthase